MAGKAGDEEILKRLRELALHRAPEGWISRAVELVRALDAPHVQDDLVPESALSAAAKAARRVLETIRLVCVVDSRRGAPLPGLRGDVSAARLLSFESDHGRLHLKVEEAGRGRLRLEGQFVPSLPDAEGAGKLTVEQAGGAKTRSLAPGRAFRVAGIRPGAVRLVIRVGRLVLATDEMMLEPEEPA